MISCLASSPQVALGISAPLIIPVLLFGGFFLQNGSVPVYLDWIRYVSWFMYGNEAMSINQWHGVNFTNPDCEFASLLENFTHYCTNIPPSVGQQLAELVQAYQRNVVCSGDDILDLYRFNPVTNLSYFILLKLRQHGHFFTHYVLRTKRIKLTR